MMEAEKDDYLRYEKFDRSDNDDEQYKYKYKCIDNSYSSIEIKVY